MSAALTSTIARWTRSRTISRWPREAASISGVTPSCMHTGRRAGSSDPRRAFSCRQRTRARSCPETESAEGQWQLSLGVFGLTGEVHVFVWCSHLLSLSPTSHDRFPRIRLQQRISTLRRDSHKTTSFGACKRKRTQSGTMTIRHSKTHVIRVVWRMVGLQQDLGNLGPAMVGRKMQCRATLL